jgi:hypothetical protein
MRQRDPLSVAIHLVDWAARTLPAAHRERYEREFFAELYGLTPSHQLRHATQVLSRAWVLRTALAEAVLATNGGEDMPIVVRRPLTCLLLRWHTWQILSTEDFSSHYVKCRKCGKESSSRFLRRPRRANDSTQSQFLHDRDLGGHTGWS